MGVDDVKDLPRCLVLQHSPRHGTLHINAVPLLGALLTVGGHKGGAALQHGKLITAIIDGIEQIPSAGGIGEGLIIKKGEILRKVKEEELLSELKYELDKML